jgi:hypothetical protein
VLGPLLFLIFINDIDMAAADIDILVKFADDTKVGQEVEEEGDRRALQSALDNLCAWSDNWGSSILRNSKGCTLAETNQTSRTQ